MDWRNQLNVYIDSINVALGRYIQVRDTKNKTLVEAMNYSLMAGGKRLRPVLALASYEIFNDVLEEILPYACGIEMIHTYSLVHDDLPAMDNDDYRRGKLTNHKVFGEGIAILAGDGLLNYAFEIMLQDAVKRDPIKPYVESIKVIAQAAGINGMIGGQVVDLESENQKIDAKTLDYIHLNKTAALIAAPLKVGAIIGKAKEEDIKNMEEIGNILGLAFQIRDDILDIEGEQEKLGKNIGSDESKNKSTYPAIYGLEYSKKKVRELTSEANRKISQYADKSKFLFELSNYLVHRES
ncbi:polyprenyl synthetase family protein [Clostridium formicaceticum]|uniref:Farnesyl diphosphate synthase n=1 Tax=Clostridium formicaceticum TaxID=1497 RepID=A0AAC9RKZ1_9CLOT|nr:farnesyl diphosphate synthase [Clostridium formicaceticum]AOY77071.1 farnesyl-diphosphate synthase [Clostridium formicaceticum]ARE87577.1 Farnesyl diphosphate synthase [Clostridium formicaceticum]